MNFFSKLDSVDNINSRRVSIFWKTENFRDSWALLVIYAKRNILFQVTSKLGKNSDLLAQLLKSLIVRIINYLFWSYKHLILDFKKVEEFFLHYLIWNLPRNYLRFRYWMLLLNVYLYRLLSQSFDTKYQLKSVAFLIAYKKHLKIWSRPPK